MPIVAEKRAAFRALHERGTFVIPNPFDAGSAVALQSLGFKALASTSAGFAWSQGRPDYRVTRDDVLSHLRALNDAVDIPLNADFENGFAHEPDGVAVNVRLVAEAGVAGLSVEDSVRDADEPLYDFEMAVDRIAAAASALEGTGVLLTARSEGFIAGRPDLDETIRRLQAYAEAGADVLYAPGLREPGQIAAIVQAVAPKPVNVLSPGIPVAELAELGVRRISVGGGLAAAAWGGFLAAARGIAEQGVFTAFDRPANGREINAMLAGAMKDRS